MRKLECKQPNGTIGLNGETWAVKNHIALVPNEAAITLAQLHPDEFQLVEKHDDKGVEQ